MADLEKAKSATLNIPRIGIKYLELKKMMNKNKMMKSKYSCGGHAKNKMNTGGAVSAKGTQPQYGKTVKDAMPKCKEC